MQIVFKTNTTDTMCLNEFMYFKRLDELEKILRFYEHFVSETTADSL